jgi:DNA-binding response OmpR family regulator
MTTEVASVRVLIVDNQSECEDIVSVFLRRWGHEVRTVIGGLFPMNEARDFAPDLVMVHVGRPEFDALSLVKRLRRRHTFGSVPLIAMSSECDPESRSAGIAAGFDQWFVKPIPLADLSGLLTDARATIAMPAGLAQRTSDNVELFDALKLEQDNQRRTEHLDQP